MVAILEAKAIITAEDRTQAAFASILARMEAVMKKGQALSVLMKSSEHSIGGIGSSIDRYGRGFAGSAEALTRAARSLERAAAQIPRGGDSARRGGGGGTGRGVGHSGGHWPAAVEHFGTPRGVQHAVRAAGMTVPVIGGAATAAGGILIGEGASYIVEKSAERQHERVRMDISGMTKSEQEDAEIRAAQLAAKYPQISQTGVLHTLRNARSVTGDYEEASKLADELLRTRVVAQAAHPGRDVEPDFDKLVKSLEQWGATTDPAKFAGALSDIRRVLAVEGDTLGAGDIYTAAKYSRQALPTASQRFQFAAAPGVAQEMGGPSFGNAAASFNRAVVGGRMDGRALQTALDLGLIDKDDVDFSKNGTPKSIKSILNGGHGVRNWKTAATDPDKWIYDTLEPALKAKGITDPTEIMQVASTLFSNRMAGDFVDKFLTQRSRIEKNEANLAKAPGDPAERIMANDPVAAWQGVKNSFENLAGSISVAGTGLTGALNQVSNVLNDGAARLQGTETERMRRAANREKYGLDSPDDMTKKPGAEFVTARDKQIAEDAKKLQALKLELAGVQAENAAIGKMGWSEYLSGGRSYGQDATLPLRIGQLQSEIKNLETEQERLRGAVPPGGPLDPATGRPWGVSAGPSRSSGTPDAMGGGGNMFGPPRPSPFGTLDPNTRGAEGPAKAEVTGTINITSVVKIEPSALLLATVAQAKQAASGGGGVKLNLGTSAPDTRPGGGD